MNLTSSAPRILLAECIHEVCSFNPIPTRYDDFYVNTGERIFSYHRGNGSEIAGAMKVFGQRSDLTLVPTFSARGITSGGTIAAAELNRLAAEFLCGVRDAGPVDAAYCALHGAMAAENEDDPEGYLLAEARKILGERIPNVASLDLHGILTDRMLQHTDAIVVYHTYPHIDYFQTGERAARLLLRLLAGEIQPVKSGIQAAQRCCKRPTSHSSSPVGRCTCSIVRCSTPRGKTRAPSTWLWSNRPIVSSTCTPNGACG